MTNVSVVNQALAATDAGHRPSLIVRMPSFIFLLLCVVAALLGAVTLFLLIVIGFVLTGIEPSNSKVAVPLTAIGLLLGFFVSPLMLVRYRRLAARRFAQPNHEQQAIPVSDDKTRLTSSSNTSRTEAAISTSVSESNAAPETLLKTLNDNQDRQFLSAMCVILVFALGAYVQFWHGGKSIAGAVVGCILGFLACYLLLVRKKQSVLWSPLPENYLTEVIKISRVHGIKGVNPQRAKIKARNQFWGLRYDFLIFSIEANKNDFWPRNLLIAPDHCYWRSGFALGRGGWQFCDTAKLRVRPFSMDVPERGFHWGKPVVGHTWEHTTMHGERDHRYKSNRQLDLVRLYCVEIVVPDGNKWLFTANQENRNVISGSLAEIVSAAKSERH